MTTVGFGAWAIGGAGDGRSAGGRRMTVSRSPAIRKVGVDLGHQLDRHRCRLRTRAFRGGRRARHRGTPGRGDRRDEVRPGLELSGGDDSHFGRLKAESIPGGGRELAPQASHRSRSTSTRSTGRTPPQRRLMRRGVRSRVCVREEGKILHAGVSNFSVEQLERIRRSDPSGRVAPAAL